MEVIHGIGSRVDLNSSQQGQTSFLDARTSRIDNVPHENVLTLVNGVGEFNHAVLGIGQTLAVGQDQFLHGALLKVGKLLQRHGNLGATVGNALEVVGSGNSRTAASINELNAGTFHLAHRAVLGHAHVGTVNDEALSAVGDVSGHGSKSGIAGKGKATQSSKVEIVAKHLDKVIFQHTRHFIGTERSGEQRVFAAKTIVHQFLNHLGFQFEIGNGTGESARDNGIKLGRVTGNALLLGGGTPNFLDLIHDGRVFILNNVQGTGGGLGGRCRGGQKGGSRAGEQEE
mmetsp:Transcript_4126/g.8524  ORF Transcript_4126/g.8524 Transcript_4126/m.8524 type:complete len:286 (-) Transcript_4126:482-1339(-)